jgi:hypothetical protein
MHDGFQYTSVAVEAWFDERSECMLIYLGRHCAFLQSWCCAYEEAIFTTAWDSLEHHNF